MFPFTLGGPPFLAFYAVLTLVLWAALWLAKRSLGAVGGTGAALPDLARDPYALACLRSGPDEAVRVAVVALVDRGALAPDGDGRVAITDDGRRLQSNAALERALLQTCRADVQLAAALPRDAGVQRTASAIEDGLRRQGLLWSPALARQRARLCWAAAAVLLAVSALRIVQTLAAGNANLGFLIGLTVLALIGVWVLAQGRLTAAGLKQLNDLQALLRDLRQRAGTLQPGTSSRDVALLAGAFGLAVLPAAAFAFAGQLYPQPASGGGSIGDSSSSSSSDGGGSSGCGGSGCGGGGSSD